MIAILVMVVDHSLLFMGETQALSVVVRATLTRSVEPLFIYVFATLTIRYERPIRTMRWLQVVLVSVVTSTLLTQHTCYAMIDILGSLAVVTPLVVMTAKLHRPALLICLYGLALLAPVPATFSGVMFDYSPALVGYQFLVVRLMHESLHKNAVIHGVVSGAIVLLAGVVLKPVHVNTLPTILVVVIGHPLAWMLFIGQRRDNSRCRRRH